MGNEKRMFRINMKGILLLTTLLFTIINGFGQISTSEKSDSPKYVGIYSTADLAYNFKDKVINPGLGRKISVGLSLTNKKRQFIGLVGVGFKFIKGNVYSPKLDHKFLKAIEDNYVPITEKNESSFIGELMGKKKGEAFSGTTAYYFHVGFIWIIKFKPSLNFYYGDEDFFLNDIGLARYEDPEHGDIHYVGMPSKFYEIKLGCTLPLKYLTKKPFCVNLNVGYKHVDYSQFKFGDTPLSSYTTGELADKYHLNHKLTISLSYTIWSNWKFK